MPTNVCKKIAMYGGTFDPMHRGHLHVIDEVYARTDYEHILCVPTSKNPMKKNNPIASNKDRLAMVSLALKDREYVSILDYEINHKNTSYTIDTISFIYNNYNIGYLLGLIIGADVVPTLHRWIHFNSLKNKIELVIIPRPHYDIEISLDVLNGFSYQILSSVVPIDIESHRLRANYLSQFSNKYIPANVLSYICTHNLYNK